MAGNNAALDLQIFDTRRNEGRIARKKGTRKLYLYFFYHGVRIERSVAAGEEHVAAGVGREPEAGLPDPAAVGIVPVADRRELAALVQRPRVVGEDPAVRVVAVAMRCEGDVNGSVGQQQARPAELRARVERQLPAGEVTLDAMKE